MSLSQVASAAFRQLRLRVIAVASLARSQEAVLGRRPAG
jgi:hypothetical protein